MEDTFVVDISVSLIFLKLEALKAIAVVTATF